MRGVYQITKRHIFEAYLYNHTLLALRAPTNGRLNILSCSLVFHNIIQFTQIQLKMIVDDYYNTLTNTISIVPIDLGSPASNSVASLDDPGHNVLTMKTLIYKGICNLQNWELSSDPERRISVGFGKVLDIYIEGPTYSTVDATLNLTFREII